MKSLTVYYDNSTLQTRLEDKAVPSPSKHEILIKVIAAGSNPKDFKHPLPNLYNNAVNQGDDCAGIVAARGSEVRSFHDGERVAGFHEMDTLHGTYAEYAICPEHTVFRIPPSMSYEEAATIPLAAFTAAVGLYQNLNLPAPWDRTDEEDGKMALVVNAASTAVGSFAIKLAQMNPRIRPIIATAGSSAEYVRSLKPDAVVDYRSPTIVDELCGALGGMRVKHVFDASNSVESVTYLTSVMEQGAKYTCTRGVSANSTLGIDDRMGTLLKGIRAQYETTFVGDVHGQPFLGDSRHGIKENGALFGRLMSQVFERKLKDGGLTGHPFSIVQDGLDGILDALNQMRAGTRVGNAKFVTRIGDTPCLRPLSECRE